MTTYRERREARAERLREWAEKREVKAEAVLQAGRVYWDDWAFVTQPGHIPQRARVMARDDRALESLRKAESMSARAQGIEAQLAGAIYSDDVDAVEQLRTRIAVLEADRDGIKAYNASCRKGAPDPAVLTEKGRRDLAVLVRIGEGAGPFPSYHLTNLTANIARNRKRLTQLEGTK